MKHIKTINAANLKAYCCKGRLRQVSGFLSVCLQDFLYSSEPEVRALRSNFENLSHASLQLIEDRGLTVLCLCSHLYTNFYGAACDPQAASR